MRPSAAEHVNQLYFARLYETHCQGVRSLRIVHLSNCERPLEC